MEKIEINKNGISYIIARYYDEELNGTTKENAKVVYVDNYDKNYNLIKTIKMVKKDEPDIIEKNKNKNLQ